MTSKTTRASILAVLTLLSTLALATPRVASADIVDRIIATVNDEVITLSDFYTNMPIFILLTGIPPQAYASDGGRRDVAALLLQELVNRELLDQEAARHELSIESREVDSHIERIASQMGRDVDGLERELATMGISFDDFWEYVRLELTKLRVINVLVASSITVTDVEVEAALRERFPEGLEQRSYQISQIMRARNRGAPDDQVRTEVVELRARVLAGESFGELAREFSQGAEAEASGAMGSFAPDRLPRVYREIVPNLEVGGVTEVIESRYGYHIVRLDAITDESGVDGAQMREQVYRELQLTKQNTQIAEYLAGLHQDNIVTLQFNPVELF